RYEARSVASDASNRDLHGSSHGIEVAPYEGSHALARHGRLRVAAGGRHFEHSDGTPFFWLGDTWWMGLCHRLHWPDEFRQLTADRVAKGYSVVQIIAGLYPDMPPFDARGANEAGYPWKPEYAGINPAYFDMADLRIAHLAEQGLVPCIVACWGYFLPLMGVEKMKQHWRNLIARWGAYPVVWCLAGEGTMPYYLSKTPKEDSAAQKQGWTELARYVRTTDPFHNLITIHPSSSGRESVEDDTVLDFDMLQTGHGDRASIANTVNRVVASLEKTPKMPVLVGEVCYEGILAASREEVQRFLFWSSVLSGAAGHTYGANGLWQLNRAEKPFGPSPHGRNWGNTPWHVAARLPGGRHLGLSKKFLAALPWWRMEPHPEWVEPHWSKENYMRPYAAGIPRELRVIFTPPAWNPPKVKGLEAGVKYRASFFDVESGVESVIGDVTPDGAGDWTPPLLPTFADWVVVSAFGQGRLGGEREPRRGPGGCHPPLS
ncbi:MAG: DUF4038 domain-containing protein, partial [Acidobacteria bacterium]|nr:DUF4038 domain-containing protein [Acidobacteriota bacterium]